MSRAAWPYLFPICLAALFAVAPWGNFPLNDDWQYALLAKRLAETGRFVVDLRIAPSVIGQSFFVRPLIALAGFSHRELRLVTIGLSLVMLWIFDGILRVGGVAFRTRLLALAVLFFNPIYFTLAQSFMTELYGYVPALGAAWIWFRGRSLGWARVVGVAAICGATFWVRQLCALVFPALVLSSVIDAWVRGETSRLRAAWPRLAVGGLVYVALIAAYFVWAKASGNLNPNFSGPLSHAGRLDPMSWIIEGAVSLVTLAAFLAPLLFGFSPRPTRGTIAFGLTLGAGLALAFFQGESAYRVSAWLHRDFPLLGNVILRGGIGPLTLSDVYLDARPRIPALPLSVWWAVEAVALFAALRFIAALRTLRARPWDRGAEIAVFGIALAASTHFVIIQAFRREVFDRYLIAPFLGLLLAAAIVMPRVSRWALAALALAWFSIAGTHDYFRWNEQRASLFAAALARGATVGDIDGGYEWNGWYFHTAPEARAARDCTAEDAWFHCAKKFRIALNPIDGYRVVARGEVSAWLTSFPSVLLLERADDTINADARTMGNAIRSSR